MERDEYAKTFNSLGAGGREVLEPLTPSKVPPKVRIVNDFNTKAGGAVQKNACFLGALDR